MTSTTQIIGIVETLTTRPGGWVSIASVREHLTGMTRAEQDTMLRQAERTPQISIIPETNQKALTRRDRDAAVEIGGKKKHLVQVNR